MSKWLENARAVAVPDVISAKTANKTPFGTNGTFGTPTEDQTKADALAEFEERTAICEYDAKLPRSHAELIAAACIVPLAPFMLSSMAQIALIGWIRERIG
jgi:hypothetical protein